MYKVYAILANNKKRIYVGLTKDLEQRIKEHNSGGTKSTKHYRPWRLFYFEELPGLFAARKREKELKSGFGKEFLKSVLNLRP